jgi:hypothetical protein
MDAPISPVTSPPPLHRCFHQVSICDVFVSISLAYLGEPNVLRLFPEALAADVEAVLADQTSFVRADTAITTQDQYAIRFLGLPTACRTIVWHPCHSCAGARTTLIRETYWRIGRVASKEDVG